MENTTLAAWIGGGCVIAAAGIGAAVAWLKKPEGHKVTTGDVSGIVAVGDNITQITGTIHNYHTPNPPSGPFVGKVATRPSIMEIADAILAAPTPFDRTQIPKNYVGLKVSWPVIFSSIDEYHDGCWYVTFDSPDEAYRSVSFDIDLKKYPKLKVIKHGHPAWIEGTISCADVRSIDLEDNAKITLA